MDRSDVYTKEMEKLIIYPRRSPAGIVMDVGIRPTPAAGGIKNLLHFARFTRSKKGGDGNLKEAGTMEKVKELESGHTQELQLWPKRIIDAVNELISKAQIAVNERARLERRLDSLESKAPPKNAPLTDGKGKLRARCTGCLFEDVLDDRIARDFTHKHCGGQLEWMRESNMIVIPKANARALVEYLGDTAELFEEYKEKMRVGFGWPMPDNAAKRWRKIKRVRDDLERKCGEKS